MKRIMGAALAALCLASPLVAHAAENLYVTDRFEITLRSGPGLDFKILDMVPSGTPLEKLEEEEGWARVRTADNKDGWVVIRYLSRETPKGPLLEAARRELDAFRTQNAELRSELESATSQGRLASDEASEFRERFETVETEFAAWKEANQDVIALRARADALEKAQTSDRAELERLRTENNSLQAREKFYWFFSGVVVLLLGWVLGYVYAASRHRAKSQSRFRF
jgi:SH3 domain protein